MRDEYDFGKAKRGAMIQSPGKIRITIMLDDDVIEYFRAQADSEGVGYQTLINARCARRQPVPQKQSPRPGRCRWQRCAAF